MNERIKTFADEAAKCSATMALPTGKNGNELFLEKFAELIVNRCTDICMDVSTKGAGIENDGSLARYCAYWIKRDFGIEE